MDISFFIFLPDACYLAIDVELESPDIPGEPLSPNQINDPAQSDIKFLIEGDVILANKAILSSRSEYFHAMFASQWRESDQVTWHS